VALAAVESEGEDAEAENTSVSSVIQELVVLDIWGTRRSGGKGYMRNASKQEEKRTRKLQRVASVVYIRGEYPGGTHSQSLAQFILKFFTCEPSLQVK
jgi:hypothetical protein